MIKSVANAAAVVDGETHFDHIRPLYIETVTLLGRLHRQSFTILRGKSSPLASCGRVVIISAQMSHTTLKNSSKWDFSIITARGSIVAQCGSSSPIRAARYVTLSFVCYARNTYTRWNKLAALIATSWRC